MKARPASLARCPSCESNDIYALAQAGGVSERSSRRGRTRAKYGCRACGKRFRKALEEAVKEPAPSPGPACIDFPVLRCPHCGSKETTTYATRPPEAGSRLRYHRCKGCAGGFSSVEPL